MIKPTPFITKNEYFKLPKDERPTTGKCDKHGDFDIKCDESLPLKLVMATCPKCTEEYSKHREEYENQERRKEKERKQKKLFEQRLANANIGSRHWDKSFDNYVADTKEKAFALETCKYVAEMTVEQKAKNVIMCGSVGTGKTHLAVSICNYLAKQEFNFKLRLETVTEIIRYIRGSYNQNSDYTEDDAIKYYSSRHLLIIDELGTSSGKDSEMNLLFEIINNRYESRFPTVIISNLEIAEVKAILGERIIDRLKEDGCRVLGMAWDSYRETNKEDF